MKSDTLIEIDDVTFGYDASRVILKDVSLRFKRGQVTSILGSSGCGKTTLMRLVTGVHGANAGRVVFDGEVIDVRDREQLYRLRRRLGMLFQFGALFTDLTVFDNVAFPLREMTDLPEPLIHDIVLMKLNAVGLRGATSLVISHDVPECMAISDHVVLMATPNGRIVAQGRPEELMGSTDPEVRQFVRGEPDGPVKFHYPAPDIAVDFGVGAGP